MNTKTTSMHALRLLLLLFFSILRCSYSQSPQNSTLKPSQPPQNGTQPSVSPKFPPEPVSESAAWATMSILLALSAFQFKAPMLWSASRSLRKFRNTPNLTKNIPEQKWSNKFCLLLFSLSKGRHNRFSRVYEQLLFFLMALVDIVSVIYPAVLDSDALLAFRLMISFGSFTVLGARPLSFLESLLFILVVSSYGGALYYTASTPFEEAPWLRLGGIVYMSILAVEGLYEAWSLRSHLSSSDTSLWGIANAKAQNKANHRQQQKWNQMKCIWNEDLNRTRGQKGGPYWAPNVFDMVQMVFETVRLISNVLCYIPGRVSSHNLPRLVLAEVMDAVSIVLLFVNRTQVEPVLFLSVLGKTQPQLYLNESGDGDDDSIATTL